MFSLYSVGGALDASKYPSAPTEQNVLAFNPATQGAVSKQCQKVCNLCWWVYESLSCLVCRSLCFKGINDSLARTRAGAREAVQLICKYYTPIACACKYPCGQPELDKTACACYSQAICQQSPHLSVILTSVSTRKPIKGWSF